MIRSIPRISHEDIGKYVDPHRRHGIRKKEPKHQLLVEGFLPLHEVQQRHARLQDSGHLQDVLFLMLRDFHVFVVKDSC